MSGGDILGYRPLYRQVRDALVKRIADGVWQAGQVVPSEPEIAADLNVSQGTVRKALDEMAAENLVIRRQGRGTFIARHDDSRLVNQFVRLIPDRGDRHLPACRVIRILAGRDPEPAEALGMPPDEGILRIDRLASIRGEHCAVERIFLPASDFSALAGHDLPDNLYELYATRYGIRIAQASERLKAVAADAEIASVLGIAPGSPLLRIERTAVALDSRRVEWRITLCRTDRIHYLSELR